MATFHFAARAGCVLISAICMGAAFAEAQSTPGPVGSGSPAPVVNAPTLTVTPATEDATSGGSPTPGAAGAASTPAGVASPSASATVSPVASATPGATPSLLKKNGVKLQFLPPPMEGLISLGIYTRDGKLARVLHRAATGDEFVAALDGYITHWDGLDDNGQAMPPGRYTARGFSVGGIGVRAVAAAQSSGTNAAASPAAQAVALDSLDAALPSLKFPGGPAFVAKKSIHAVLVSNPLDRDRAGGADLVVGIDANGSWLELADGLPLKQISTTPNLKWAVLGRPAPGEPFVVYQSDGTTLQEFVLTKVSNMMAFDCGTFELSAGDISRAGR